MDLGFHDPALLDAPVEGAMGPRLPTIGLGQPIALAVELLETAPAIIVMSGGRPTCVLGRSDVLAYLSTGQAEAAG
jgi:cystathionine beta-synthase